MKKHLQLLVLFAALMVPWVVQGQSFNSTFETTADQQAWTISNSSATNGWYIGTATNNGGTHALYISNNNGSSAAYTISSTSNVFAYRTITVDTAGDFAYSFDWKANGESCCDYLRAAIMPGSYSLPTHGSTSPSAWTVSTGSAVTGCTADLTGNNRLNQNSSWTTVTGTVTLAVGTYKIIFFWHNDGSVGTNPPGCIDNVIFTRLTCPSVQNLTVLNLETTSFDIEWSDVAGATEWLVRLGTDGTPVTVYDTAYSFTALTPNTPYTVSVAPICSGNDTGMWNTITVRTPCAYMTTLPYVQNFEAATSGSSTSETFVNCMTRLNNGSQYFGYPYATSNALYNHTPNGSKGLYWYNTTTTGTYGDYQCVVLPGVDTDYFPVNTLRVAFWSRSSSTSYNPTFYVGVMTNPNDISTFSPVDTINVGTSTQWRLYESDLSSYTGDGRFVAIRANRQSSSWYAYVDDITLMVNPSCDHPTNLVISDVTNEGFTATWHGDAINASGYHVVLDTVGGTDEQDVYDTTVTFYNLPAGRRCTFSVSTLCSLGDTTMAMTTIVTTYCDALTTLPYTYGFEGLNTGTTTERPVIPCWHHLNNGTSYYGYPYVSSTYHTGSRSLYWYATTTQATYGDYQVVVLPPVDTDTYAMNTLMLDFWARPSSTSYSPVFQVGIMSDPNDISTFQLVSTVNVLSSTDWQHFEVMFDDFAGSGQFVALRANRPTSSWYAYTDDFTLKEIPSCPHVVDLVSTHVTGDTIEVSWSPVGTEGVWIVAIGADTNVSYDSTYIFDNLLSNTLYTISVAPLCDNGDTAEFISIQVRTSCGYAVLPIIENFDGMTGSSSTSGVANNLPACWDYYNHGTRTSYQGCPYVYNSTSYTHSGANCIRHYSYYSSGDSNQYLILPVTDPYSAPMSRLKISFWQRGYSTSSSYHSNVVVGVMSDITREASFVPCTTFTYTSTTYIHREYSFENYTGAAGRVALKFPKPTTSSPGYNYGYIDDITLELLPDCPAVSNIVATSVGPNDASISWTENGTSSSWTIEYGPVGFTPGTGTTDNVYSLPYSITGLTPNTEYSIRVTPDCTIGDGIAGTAVGSFRTACAFVDSLPIIQDFESAATGSSTSTTFINCWTRLNNGTQYFGYPYVSSSSSYNHTENGSKGLYWYGSTTTGTYGDYQYVVFPGLDTDVVAINSVMFSFWVKSSSTSYYPVFQVGVMNSPTDPSTFHQVANINVGNNTAWALKEVSFENYTGSGNFIALRALRPSSSWYAYVDDLKLERLPDCPHVNNLAVSNITTTTAVVNWTEAGTATSWDIEYGPVGFTRGTGIMETAYTHPHTLTNLNANTAYTIYVTPYCDGVAAEASINFRTECDLETTLPITMGFETSDGVTTTGTSTNDVFVECWHRLNNGTMYFGYPYVGSSTTYAHTGSRGLYWYNTTTTGTYGDYQIVVLPGIDPDSYPLNTLQLKFWAKNSSAASPAVFDIGVMTDPNNVNTFQQLMSVNVTGADWNEYTVGLANYLGNGNYVAIRAQRSSWTAYVDDITLETAPTCPAANNINVSTVGTTGAQFSWGVQAGFADSPISYDAEVIDVLTGVSMGTYSPSISQTLVTGLTPNTEYKFRVRTLCENEYGGWDSVVFSTNGMPCLVPDPNSTHTFTLNSGTSGTDYYLPLNNYYNYSYTQQLILASEMNGPSTITGIDFQYNYSTAMTSKTNCTIYLANVSVSDLSSGFVPYSASTFQAVYTGTLNCNSSNSGWNHFNFTTPFVYTGGNLLVVVHDNSGSYNSSSYVFTHHSTTGTMGRHIYNDSSPYTISSVSGGNGVSYRNNMKLYTYGCAQAGTCAAPLVVIDSMGSNYIDVSWAPGYQESSWTVEYRRDDSTTWTSLGTVTSMSSSITGLTPNYTYHVRVTSHCTDTDMASTVTARTPCTPDTLPFFTSFEDFAGSSASYAMPTCWTRNSNYGSYYPYSSTSYYHSGTKSVYVYSTNTSWSYFTLPPFDAPVDSLYVNFWLLKTNTSYAHAVKVGVMTDPADVSTFTEIGTATPQNLSQWENFEFYLDSYTGTGQYITIMSPNGVYCYPYLDDLKVDRIPNCRRVQGLIVDNVTHQSAHASWIAGDVTDFEAVCVPYGMAPDSGNIVGVYDDSITFTGLTHSTAYMVYVRALCSSGDTSEWSVGCSFRTSCGMIDSLPYFEDLEAVATGSSNTGTSFIPCWTRINNGTSYGGYPYVSSSTSYNHTPGGTRGLYWYNTTTTGTYGDYEYVVFPQIDTATLPINAIQLSFWAKSSSTTYYPVFEVGVMRDVNDTAMDVLRTFDVNPDGTASWHEFVVPFGRYSGNGSYIGIRALRATASWYAYVDDFRLDSMPSCPAPTNVVLDSVSQHDLYLTILSSGDESSWEVRYNDTAFVVNDTNVQLTGLTPNTPYTISVRALCGSGDTSDATIVSYRTSCMVIDSVPFFENFESYIASGSSSNRELGIPCWGRYTDASTYYYPYLSSSSTYNHTPGGTKGFYWYCSSTTSSYGNYQMIVTPEIDTVMLPINTLQLSFWAKASSTSYNPVFQVGVITNDNLNTFIPVDTVRVGTTTTWTEFNVPLANLTGTGNRIVIRSAYALTSSSWYAYFDDITIDVIPTCPHVDNFAVSNTSPTSVTLTWTEHGSAVEWETYMDTLSNVTPTGDSIVTTTPGITYNNLTPGQYYYFWCRPVCGYDDTGRWEGPILGVPNTWTMRANMNDSISMCGGVIFDDGGPGGDYSNSQTSSLVVYPATPGALVQIQGTYTGEGCCDYISIYDGVGTAGTQFIHTCSPSSGTAVTIGPFVSQNGPLTITFTSDGSVTNSGFALQVSCLSTHCRATNLRVNTAVPAMSTQLALTWDTCGAVSYEVEYGTPGFTQGTGTLLTTNTNNVIIPGLTSLTTYEVYVRAICGVGDTGDWTSARFQTTLCDNPLVAATGTQNSSGTTYHSPVNNYYCYTLTETIFDSAEMGGPMDIGYISYYYDYSDASTMKTNCTIYFKPTNRTVFSSGSDIELLDSTAVMVYTGPLNCTQGWNYFNLDTVYHYDGLTNLMVIVDDNSGDYDGDEYVFKSNSCSGYKTLEWYSDSYDASPTSASYSGTQTYYQYRVVMQLLSCNTAPTCHAPVITSSTGDYHSRTITWSGNGNAYEVACKATATPTWPTATPVTANSYTFTGLQPSTAYMFRVRQDCTVDTLGYSAWTEGSFVTDSLGCVPPTALTMTGVTNSTASFSWTPAGNETAWQMRVYNSTYDSVYAPVTTASATVGGLATGVTYYAAVRALCGSSQDVEGIWSDSIQFATQTCPNVTGVTSSGVTFNSLTLSWNTVAAAQNGYEVEYGMQGFTQGNGIATLSTTTNSLTVTGLMDETSYDFYVRAVCGTGWTSENWSSVLTVTTGSATGTTYTVTLTVNNSQWGQTFGSGLYAENSQVTISATPNTGYHFVQWSDNDTHAVRTFTITSDVTLMATFAPNTYTVTVASNDPAMGTATVSGTGVFNYNAQATLTATPATGHHFLQWNDGDTHMVRTITVVSDTSFTATFAPNQYTVTATANDATMGNVTGGGTYNYGATATLQAVPNTGYYFHRWNDGNVDNPRTFVVTGDVTYTAIFSNDSNSTQTYTVTLNVNDPAMGQVHGAGTYAEGSEIEISATPNTGYRFVTWSDNVTSNPRTLTVTADITLTANFSTAVDSSALLVVTYNPMMGMIEINGRETDTYNGRLGDEVRLNAIPYEGFSFVGWTDGVDTPQRTLTLRQNRTEIGANFSDGNGILTVDGTVSCLIYPNPASSSTTISVSGANGKVRIAVVDINGRVVASETLECAGDCMKSMDIDNLSQGAYFVRITGEQINLVKKLIVR